MMLFGTGSYMEEAVLLRPRIPRDEETIFLSIVAAFPL